MNMRRALGDPRGFYRAGWMAVASVPWFWPAAVAWLLPFGLLEACPAQAAADAKADKFVRVQRNDKDVVTALETAIVSFQGKDAAGTPAGDATPLTVDLIGVVHVGDSAYYKKLNALFKKYDAVLYELVAEEGTRIEPGQRRAGGGAIMAMQGGMKSLLDLSHQLDEIDYRPKNLFHADMSPEEFDKSMKERGESFQKMFFRALGRSMVEQHKPGGPNEVELLFAFFADDRALRLKRALAVQFEDLDRAAKMFAGPDGSTIIEERNKKAFSVLKERIAAGDKKIAIFYGAGHLPHMEQQLDKDFGLTRAGAQWLTAWDLSK